MSKTADKEYCLIVIVILDQLDFTKGCIESIQRNTKYPYKILVIDNGSKQETLNYLNEVKKGKNIDVIFNKENQGWVKAVNQGLFHTDSPYVCVMNNDIVVYPNWLEEIINGFKSDKTVGVVNPLWGLPKRFKGSRDQYFQKVISKQRGKYIDTDWVRGFCYVVKREVIDATGGLDYDFSPAYYDDWDFSLRVIKKGYKCIRAKGSFVYHYKNISYLEALGSKEFDKLFKDKAKIFHKKWGFPLRILFIIDFKLESEIKKLQKLLARLLKAQDKIYIISKESVGIEHTNCYIKVKKFFINFWISVFFSILDNLRHSPAKRFNIVISGKSGIALSKMPFIKNNYYFIIWGKDKTFEIDEVYNLIQSKKEYMS